MQIFIDSADIHEIRKAAAYGVVDGVTTNPSLVAKTGRGMRDVLTDICAAVPGPVSAEVLSTETEGMLAEARELAKIAPNIVIKIPLIPAGLRAVKILSAQGIKTNVTLCFSTLQAWLAAKAGATYISPFVGRLDDVGENGMDLIAQIVHAYRNYGFETQVLVASVRTPAHVLKSLEIGAHVATIPPNLIELMFQHPLTDRGLERFLADAAKIPRDL
jgi:transaldolase